MSTYDAAMQAKADREFGSRTEAFAAEGLIIDANVSIERSIWSISKGSYDAQEVGVFLGTEAEANALVAELNLKDAANIHFDGDGYTADPATPIRSAADVLAVNNAIGR